MDLEKAEKVLSFYVYKDLIFEPLKIILILKLIKLIKVEIPGFISFLLAISCGISTSICLIYLIGFIGVIFLF